MEKPAPDPGRHEPPEAPLDSLEFLARTWSLSAFEVSKALTPPSHPPAALNEDAKAEGSGGAAAARFSFASSETSQMIMERIMSQSQQEISSPRTSGRLSHSSGPLIGAHSCGGSFSDSPPVSPSDIDDVKHHHRPITPRFRGSTAVGAAAGAIAGAGPVPGTGSRTVGRWLKDRRERKKEETRAQNAQLHAAVQVAGVAAAVAAITAATASQPGKDEATAKTDMAVASAARLVAAQCVEAAEAVGAERDLLASVVESAISVRSSGDIMTLTAAAATALRGAATLKSRALKEVWNIAAVIPVEKGVAGSNGGDSSEVLSEDNILALGSREFLARGSELLKRTRKGDLHWKIVSAYIDRMNQVILKMKSRHVAGTMTKKKKTVVLEVKKNMPMWPGRDLVGGSESFRYFGLKTLTRGVIQFECKCQREYDLWTQGVSRLLALSAEKKEKSEAERKQRRTSGLKSWPKY